MNELDWQLKIITLLLVKFGIEYQKNKVNPCGFAKKQEDVA